MNYLGNANSCRILITEDDVAQQALFAKVLELEGFFVFVTSTADEAVQALRTVDRIDLLIADILLKGPVNGLELAIQVQRLQPRLRTLFIKGCSKETAFELDAADR